MVKARQVRPGYIRVGDRNVHWHEVGTGKLLVMLHASPGSGKALLPLARQLEGWRVLVLDTPGCGRSDPLTEEQPSIDDYAQATLEALDALGVTRCAVFGTHTGAKIALAMVHAQPGRFNGLVLDGLAVYTPEERDDLSAHYTPSYDPLADGSHLIRVWHQVRDMALFWPWYSQDGAHRIRVTPPSPESMHETVVDVLRNLDHYGRSYQAAFRHDPLPRLGQLPVPTLLLAAADDPLHAHLDRVSQACDRLAVNTDASQPHASRILEWLKPLLEGQDEQPAFDDLQRAGAKPGVTRAYLKSNYGKDVVHVTVCTPVKEARRPLVAMHACPGAGRSLLGLAGRAAQDRLVVLPDLPGLGASSLPGDVEPSVEELSAILGETLFDFVGEPADLYGTHTGAAFALEWADTGTFPAHSVLLDGMMLEDATPGRDELLQHYAAPLPPTAHGMHLLDAWHRVRDMMLFWPWYRHQAETARMGAGIPGPRILQGLVVDFLGASTTYHHLYKAAFRFHAEERLERLAVPAVLSAQSGDPLGSWLPVNRQFAPSVSVRAGALKQGLDSVMLVLNELSELGN
jgi:pimeloyl-ACP methyl ester carboxylesterase